MQLFASKLPVWTLRFHMAVLIFSIRNADNLVLITLISFPYEDQELGQGSTHHSLFGGKYSKFGGIELF